MLNKNEMYIKIINEAPNKADDKEIVQKSSKKKEEKPEDLLRRNGYKIKLVTPTSFGTQYTMAKAFNKEDIEKVLAGYNLKFKGDSEVFVVS